MYHKDKAVQMTSDDHAYKDERRLLIDTSANGHHGIERDLDGALHEHISTNDPFCSKQPSLVSMN